MTLVPLGAIAACFTVVAVLGWFGEIAQADAERIPFTVFAVIFDLIFVLALVFGAVEVTRQFAREGRPHQGKSGSRSHCRLFCRRDPQVAVAGLVHA